MNEEVSEAACQTEENKGLNAEEVSKSKIKILFQFHTGLRYSVHIMKE
jgi:hypothetical protein